MDTRFLSTNTSTLVFSVQCKYSNIVKNKEKYFNTVCKSRWL